MDAGADKASSIRERQVADTLATVSGDQGVGRAEAGAAQVGESDLVSLLAELGSLLHRCDEDDRANWLAGLRDAIAAGDVAPTVRSLRGQLAGGMGSILDISMVPADGSDLRPGAAHAQLWNLVERIDAVSADL